MVPAGSRPASRLFSLKSRAAFAALLLGFAASLTAQDASRLEAEAKRAFDGGRFTEAGDKYAKAAEQTAPADRKAELYFQSGWAYFIGGPPPAPPHRPT